MVRSSRKAFVEELIATALWRGRQKRVGAGENVSPIAKRTGGFVDFKYVRNGQRKAGHMKLAKRTLSFLAAATAMDRRIRVNAISPGSIDTPAANDLLASSEVGEQRRKMVSTSVPLSRFGRMDEVAKAVVFLASEDSSYVTGRELFVDGGFAQV